MVATRRLPEGRPPAPARSPASSILLSRSASAAGCRPTATVRSTYAVAVHAWAFHWRNTVAALQPSRDPAGGDPPPATTTPRPASRSTACCSSRHRCSASPPRGGPTVRPAARPDCRLRQQACLCPLVFGFPTEMWMAHALFWPTLAACHFARPGAAGSAAVFALLLALRIREGAGLRVAILARWSCAAGCRSGVLRARWPVSPPCWRSGAAVGSTRPMPITRRSRSAPRSIAIDVTEGRRSLPLLFAFVFISPRPCCCAGRGGEPGRRRRSGGRGAARDLPAWAAPSRASTWSLGCWRRTALLIATPPGRTPAASRPAPKAASCGGAHAAAGCSTRLPAGSAAAGVAS